MSMTDKKKPKVFISYSWSSQEHIDRVQQIASRLVESGVDVMLDKWDLAEGASVHAYMEKIVTDQELTKVLIVCDQMYSEKADNRSGGVGTETLIITPDLYDQEDKTSREQKYIPIVTEKDDNGKAYLPVYLKGRYYVDMSGGVDESEAFEKIVRNIYNMYRDSIPLTLPPLAG